ncbi:MAG: hypothetical protein SOV30_05245, partial [Dialister sp.]|nr:hypothetical protein [Dialister sp.]
LNAAFEHRHYLYSAVLPYFYAPHQHSSLLTPHSSLLTGEQSFHPQSVDEPPQGANPEPINLNPEPQPTINNNLSIK